MQINEVSYPEANKSQHSFSSIRLPHLLKTLKVRNNKGLFTIALGLILLFVIVFILAKVFVLPYRQSFKLSESGYSYQIAKCWKTNPPSYWIKRVKNNDNNSYVKVGRCSFQGVGAILIKDTTLNFDELLNRNLTVQGSLIKSGLVNYYKLDFAVLETSSPETNILSGNGQPSDNKTYADEKVGYWEIFLKTDNSSFPTGIKLYVQYPIIRTKCLILSGN